MTLLELTVVILVLLSLISILFVGARAWKKGSDRAGCIINIRNTQQAVRGFLNMHPDLTACATTDIYGPASFLKFPKCPASASPASDSAPVGYDYNDNSQTPGDAIGASICLTCTVDPDTHIPGGDLSQW